MTLGGPTSAAADGSRAISIRSDEVSTPRGAVERLRAANDGRECGLRDAAEEHRKETDLIGSKDVQLKAIVFFGFAAFSEWYLVASASYLAVMRATVACSSRRCVLSGSASMRSRIPAVEQNLLRCW